MRLMKMSDNIPMDDLVGDKRGIVVKGRKYYTMTANRCTTCSGDDRFMYVKQKLSGGTDVVLECPNCDSYITLKAEMINMNLNK